MPYNKNNWNTGDIITAFKMRKIEDQLVEVSKEIDSAIDSNVEGNLGQRINDILHKLESSIANAGVYTIGEDYAVDDYVYYEENLYKCIFAIQNADAWNESKWEKINLLDIIEEIKLSITNNSENIPELPIFIATYDVTTFEEVNSAITEGKIIFAIKDGIIYLLSGTGTLNNNIIRYTFTNIDAGIMNVISLNSNTNIGWDIINDAEALAPLNSPNLIYPRSVMEPPQAANNNLLATTKFVKTAISNASNIFIATYGTTTTAEIYTAKSAGKQIFANKNGIYYPLVGGGNTSTGASAYALVDGSGYVINILRLANPSTWTSSSMTLAESDSPVLTNARASETPAASSNDTHLATTAFVQTAVSNATILISPDGTKYKLSVANDGTLSTEVVTQ